MDKYLLELSANELLKKFGAGEHKPGSGSAVAFQGMLSAQLIHTVISLTTNSKHRHLYTNCIDDLLKIDAEIQERIYPKAEDLFHEDSAHFDKAIKLRRERDAANGSIRKILSNEALAALKPATEKTPIQIAEICIELAEFGLLVF